MNDDPDRWGKRGAAADIVDLNPPMRRVLAAVDEALEYQPPDPPPAARKATDVENLAIWADHLRYRDLTKACAEIAGDDEKGMVLAQQFAAWAEQKVEAAIKDGVSL